MEKAAEALTEARRAKRGDFPRPGLIKGITDLHREYLEEMAARGVPSRRIGPRVRVKAKNHGSTRGHEEELLEKAWKDAKYGGVILCSDDDEGVARILDACNVVESPGGCVAKLNPDHTVSTEIRSIHDMRSENEANDKYSHPPADQPKHVQLARKAFCWRARHPKVALRCAKKGPAKGL